MWDIGNDPSPQEEMEYIINHKRFKKKYSFSELDKKGSWSEIKISKFPNLAKDYFDFFNGYAKENYKLIPTKCLCGNDNDILLSQSDRHGVEFPTVVCKECGLIRAKDYFTNENVKDFYQNYYRPGPNSLNINYGNSDPEIFFLDNILFPNFSIISTLLLLPFFCLL